LLLGEKAGSLDEARYLAESALKDGRAWKKFRRLVDVQGGDVSQVDDPSLLPGAPFVEVINSPMYGWLKAIDAREVGEASVDLGAGRVRKDDTIDPSVGIIIHRKVGDRVGIGDPLFTIHTNSKEKLASAKDRLLAAHLWSDQPCPRLPLFYDVIG
ncbi:MAG: pyrimidine-nucleoside phosphorylase, partial [Bellilinea sp.]